MKTRIVKARSEDDIAAAAATGASALAEGKLVAFPTETVYGLAAAATIPEAMARLRELKNRPDLPFTVHVASAEDVGRYVADVPDQAARLIAKAWPGPVTLLLPVGDRLADEKLHAAGMSERLCWEGAIGLRCPVPAVSRQMLAATAEPVVAPSANPAGLPAPTNPAGVLAGSHLARA